jgi:hypothetical protein
MKNKSKTPDIIFGIDIVNEILFRGVLLYWVYLGNRLYIGGIEFKKLRRTVFTAAYIDC